MVAERALGEELLVDGSGYLSPSPCLVGTSWWPWASFLSPLPSVASLVLVYLFRRSLCWLLSCLAFLSPATGPLLQLFLLPGKLLQF